MTRTETSAAAAHTPISLTGILDSIPKLTSAIAGGSIAIAVAYQMGYFFAIDPKLFSYLTIQDSLLDALQVFPGVALLAGIVYGAGPFVRRTRKVKYIKPLIILPSTIALAAIIYSKWGEPAAIGNAVIGFVGGLVSAIVSVLLIFDKPLRVSIPTFCIIAIVVSAVIGLINARHDLAMEDYDFTVRAKSGSSVEAVLLKAGSNFTIFKNQQHTIVIMPTPDVALIERHPL